MTSSNEAKNESSKFCTSAAAVYYYGIRLTSYICEYFNTTVPNNREFKNTKIANPQNTNPAKIKAYTVFTVLCDTLYVVSICSM